MKNMENYKTVFSDYWDLFKRYSNVEFTDEYWKNLSDDVNKTYIRHGKAPISYKLGMVVLEEMECVHNKLYGGI